VEFDKEVLLCYGTEFRWDNCKVYLAQRLARNSRALLRFISSYDNTKGRTLMAVLKVVTLVMEAYIQHVEGTSSRALISPFEYLSGRDLSRVWTDYGHVSIKGAFSIHGDTEVTALKHLQLYGNNSTQAHQVYQSFQAIFRAILQIVEGQFNQGDSRVHRH
jgi:hypothetical protein